MIDIEESSLALDEIRIDGGTQPRCEIDESLVAEYAEAVAAGEKFPPVIVFFDGVDNWLADGFHRYHAAGRAGLDDLPADVRNGTLRDAILYSVGANAAHGQRRTNADKHKSVMTLLEDEEWSKKQDQEIAEIAWVTKRYVNKLRNSLREQFPNDGESQDSQDDNNRNDGHTNPPEPEPNEPTPGSTPPPELGPPADGLQFARMAIADLEQIRDDDIQRDEAFAMVMNWISGRIKC